jgi:hypothetical protein
MHGETLEKKMQMTHNMSAYFTSVHLLVHYIIANITDIIAKTGVLESRRITFLRIVIIIFRFFNTTLVCKNSSQNCNTRSKALSSPAIKVTFCCCFYYEIIFASSFVLQLQVNTAPATTHGITSDVKSHEEVMRHQLEAIFTSLKFKSHISNVIDKLFSPTCFNEDIKRVLEKRGLENKMKSNDLGIISLTNFNAQFFIQ